MMREIKLEAYKHFLNMYLRIEIQSKWALYFSEKDGLNLLAELISTF